MPRLYLVRHGQASFGADDYDKLSELGATQCRWLGEHMRRGGRRFEAVFTGRLTRHRESLAALAEGLADPALPPATQLPALDEYDADRLVAAVHPGPLVRARTPEAARQHFRLLRDALAAWMDGRIAPEGVPRHADFMAGIADTLERVRTQCGGDVLIVSSGGPISHAVAQVLGVPAAATIELNMRLRNSALTEFEFTPRRHALLVFNATPHLDTVERARAITYA